MVSYAASATNERGAAALCGCREGNGLPFHGTGGAAE
nr:MAG TPA_asm: hypothetical protein [Caudoviricetes sp.]DAS94742.1 MAG TPA: hypothetical protein [Caudoviricetes sp.]